MMTLLPGMYLACLPYSSGLNDILCGEPIGGVPMTATTAHAHGIILANLHCDDGWWEV